MSSFRGYRADASPDTLSSEQSIRRPTTNPTDAKTAVIGVGRSLLGTPHILDEDGHELPPGEPGSRSKTATP